MALREYAAERAGACEACERFSLSGEEQEIESCAFEFEFSSALEGRFQRVFVLGAIAVEDCGSLLLVRELGDEFVRIGWLM